MAVIFTAHLRVSDWRGLRRLSDETLILYARAAGARRYRLYRNAHDAAAALLLVEAATLEDLRALRDALLAQGELAPGAGPPGGGLWEPAECRAIEG